MCDVVCAEAIKPTTCNYAIKRLSMAQNCCLDSNTGWIGIPGHGVGVHKVPVLDPGRTTQFFYPSSLGDEMRGDRVKNDTISMYTEISTCDGE